MDVRNGGSSTTQMSKLTLIDVQERLAYVLAKQTEWAGVKAVQDCIAAVESLTQQGPLELARQGLRDVKPKLPVPPAIRTVCEGGF